MAKKNKSAIIRNFLCDNPTMGPAEIAKKLNTTVSLVSVCKNELKKKGVYFPTLRNTRPVKPKAAVAAPQQIEMFEPAADPVNHPAHYKVGGIETIDFIEAKKLNYNLGNAVKYITRADHKGNRKQDLEKALWYIKRELSAV